MGIYIGSDGKEYEYKRVLSMTAGCADVTIFEPNITQEESDKVWQNFVDDIGPLLLEDIKIDYFEYLKEHPTATFEEYKQEFEEECKKYLDSIPSTPLVDITKEYEAQYVK